MRLLTPSVVAAILSVLVWPVLAHAVEVWSTDEEFGYGFLVPLISVALIWLRRTALLRSLGNGSWSGLAIVVASLALYVFAQRSGVHVLAGIAISPLLLGSAIWLWGWNAGRVLAFPLGFLVFGLGLYRGLLSSVGFALQNITAVGAVAVAHGVGIPVVRDGLLLQSEQFAFIVAEQCSGMSSLLSLLALAALWTNLVRASMPARLGVMLSVLPLVVVANTTRVTLVVLVATWFGQDVAIGFFHAVSSLVLFGLALGGLLIVSRLVGCRGFSFALSA